MVRAVQGVVADEREDGEYDDDEEEEKRKEEEASSKATKTSKND
jgi:hypothetical protein